MFSEVLPSCTKQSPDDEQISAKVGSFGMTDLTEITLFVHLQQSVQYVCKQWAQAIRQAPYLPGQHPEIAEHPELFAGQDQPKWMRSTLFMHQCGKLLLVQLL